MEIGESGRSNCFWNDGDAPSFIGGGIYMGYIFIKMH